MKRRLGEPGRRRAAARRTVAARPRGSGDCCSRPRRRQPTWLSLTAVQTGQGGRLRRRRGLDPRARFGCAPGAGVTRRQHRRDPAGGHRRGLGPGSRHRHPAGLVGRPARHRARPDQHRAEGRWRGGRGRSRRRPGQDRAGLRAGRGHVGVRRHGRDGGDGRRALAHRLLRSTEFDLTVQRGPNRFDPEETLSFSRSRRELDAGDFERSANQQQVMLGILKAMRAQEDDEGFIETGALAALGAMTTDLSPTRLYRLAQAVTRVEPGEVTVCVVAGPTGRGVRRQHRAGRTRPTPRGSDATPGTTLASARLRRLACGSLQARPRGPSRSPAHGAPRAAWRRCCWHGCARS